MSYDDNQQVWHELDRVKARVDQTYHERQAIRQEISELRRALSDAVRLTEAQAETIAALKQRIADLEHTSGLNTKDGADMATSRKGVADDAA